MAVVAQRDGIRVIAFQKCGHTSIINMFLTPAGMPLARGTAPAIRNSSDKTPAPEVYRGDVVAAQSWPEPELTIAFFRNPLGRALSAYEHFIVRTLQYPVDSPVVTPGGETKAGIPTLGRQSFTDLGFTPDMDFQAFCSHLRGINLAVDNHLKPQSTSFLEAYGSNTTNVHAGQLEQLNTIWPLIVEQYDLDCTLEVPRYNAAKYETENRLDGAYLNQFEALYARDYAFWEAAHFEARAPLSSVCH